MVDLRPKWEKREALDNNCIVYAIVLLPVGHVSSSETGPIEENWGGVSYEGLPQSSSPELFTRHRGVQTR